MNGTVEQYEGPQAFQWCNAMIQQHSPPPMPQSPSQPSQPSQPPQPSHPPQHPSPSPKKHVEPKEEDSEEEEEERPRPRRRPKKQDKTKRMAISSLPEMDDSEEEEEDIHHIPRPKVAAIRRDSGNYEDPEVWGEQQEPNRNVVRGIRKDNGVTDRGGLLAQAAAMQKTRDAEENENLRSGPAVAAMN